MPRKIVPENRAAVQTKRLAGRLATSTEAILNAMDTVIATADDPSRDVLKHVRGWCVDALADAKRLQQTLA